MSNKQKNIFIYVLECSTDKYYIGKTNNPQFCFEQHFTTNSTSWTTMMLLLIKIFRFFINNNQVQTYKIISTYF